MVSDPVVLEIVKNALGTVAEEMGLAVVRAAYSSLVKESGDASSGIFDAQGRLISQSLGAPLMHLSSLRPTLREVMTDFPPDTMQPGDIYMSNDPYRGGIHSNDIMIYEPIFANGRLSFFTGTLIHVADVGGLSAGGLPATATEMFHEGLILPPVKLFNAGKPNEALMKIIPANSRTPEKVMGDIRALVGACHVGGMRLVDLAKKYGHDELDAITAELMDYSERRMRQEIQKIPPGRYEGSFVIDDDGVDFKPEGFTVKVAIRVEGSSFQADFTGTSKQARGPINAALSQAMSGVLFGLRAVIDPSIPMNDGCYRPLDVVFPPGTLVNPRPPAPCNARMATVMAVVEAMLNAFSKAYPQKAVASCANIHVYTMGGADPETGQAWSFMDPNPGGIGGRNGKDGVDVSGGLIFAGGGANQAIEAYEIEYPILYKRMEIWEDSGGAGRWRGGSGLRREVQMLAPGSTTVRATDRCRFPPPGNYGGDPGKGGGWVINMNTPEEKVLPGKASGVPLKEGDTLTMLTSGGGGFGNPLERPPERVLQDVLDHKVSLTAARDSYGVAIDPSAMTVDVKATERLRAALAAKR